MKVYHIYNQVRPFVWQNSGVITTDKPESGRWVEHDVKPLANGQLRGRDKRYIIRSDSICVGASNDGSQWEMFIDTCYFDMGCVKQVNDRDFNSPHNYNFGTVEDAINEMNEILEKWPG